MIGRGLLGYSEPLKHIRLDSRVELHDLVPKAKLPPSWQGQDLDRNEIKQLARPLKPFAHAVSQYYDSSRLRVVLCDRLHQGNRVGHIVRRHDGEYRQGMGSHCNLGLHRPRQEPLARLWR